ncbi:MAG: S24/S26 family peptidase [Acidobacteriota bacterium]
MNHSEANPALWPAICQLTGNNRLTLRVSGQCMAPCLENDARVTVRRARAYLPGDVLVVTRALGRPVVHRLIGLFPAKGSLRYLTQADNSPTPDGSVTRDAILGRVCGGQCSPLAVTIPLRHRAKAVGRFVTFLGTRLRQRTWSLLKTT